jgi:hypothetical protein
MVVFLASDLARDVTGKVARAEGRRIGTFEVAMPAMLEADWTPLSIADRAHEIFT